MTYSVLGWPITFAGCSVPPLHPDSPYGYICRCGGDSYLSAALSSVWAFLIVVVIAFTAGITFPFKHRIAWWMLGVGAAISLLDAGVRFRHRYAFYPAAIRELIISWLPDQIVADIIFQFAVPFRACTGCSARLVFAMIGC